jgi:pimeloyl-ACP methyl ester carboxylesterase
MAAMSSTEGAEPAERYATVNGLRIHYLEWGNRGNRPLVLLHGIARVAHTFDHAAPHFSGSYRFLEKNLRKS